MPAVAMASKTACMPPMGPGMKKPPPAVKLCPWKCVDSNTITVRTGMSTFHDVIQLLAWAR